MSASGYVLVGLAVKPHGVKGEIGVRWYADSPFLLDGLDHIHLARADADSRPLGRPRRYGVASWRPHKDLVLLTLKNVSGRDQAEGLRGLSLFIPASDLPEPGEHEVYLHEILGLAAELEDGSHLGRITDILLPTPEQEIWSIETPEGREVLYPVHEETVLEIDLDAGRVVLDPPPGLLEIYLPGPDEFDTDESDTEEEPE